MESYFIYPSTPVPSGDPNPNDSEDEFDRLRKGLLATATRNEGWQSELQKYLKDILADVSKETDIVQWWAVSSFYIFIYVAFLHFK